MPLFSGDHSDLPKQGWGSHKRLFVVLTPLIVLTVMIAILVLQPLRPQDAANASDQSLSSLTEALSPLIAQSDLIGQEDNQEQLHLSLGLTPRNQGEIEKDLAAIAQGTMRPLTQAQYIERFSPRVATYQAAQDFLKQNGFTITRTYKHRLMLDFSGTVEQAERVFHVIINRYTSPKGRPFYANDAPPQLPGWLTKELTSINGLSSSAHWEHPPLLPQSKPRHSQKKHANTCPGNGNDVLLPSEFAKAYNLNDLYAQGYQGQGQSIAIFAMATFNENDLHAYARCFGNSQTKIMAIPTGSHYPTNTDGQIETELDAELILSTVPHLDSLKIYETANNENDYLAQWARIVDDNVPVVTISWGQCEAEATPQTLRQESELLRTAALQGQNIFAASGDTGSDACDDHSGNHLSASDPDAQPYVTSVGGTSLDLDGGQYSGETTWNNHLYRQEGSGNDGASGGGISRYWTMPDWQQAPGVPDDLYSSSQPCAEHTGNTGKYCRQVPDVSIHADPHKGYWVYCSVGESCDPDDPWIVMGGTSAAAPLWASLIAIVDQMSLQQTGHRIGFVTPLLYKIARDPAKYAASFHDVTTGHTDYRGNNQGLYPAQKGYDMATGLGSYNAPALAKNLVDMKR